MQQDIAYTVAKSDKPIGVSIPMVKGAAFDPSEIQYAKRAKTMQKSNRKHSKGPDMKLLE